MTSTRLSGLTQEEATRRFQAFGPNELAATQGRNLPRIVVETMREPMFLLLQYMNGSQLLFRRLASQSSWAGGRACARDAASPKPVAPPIMEHEHVPEIEATAIASELLHRKGGAGEIREMLVDDLAAACRRGEHRHTAVLFAALRRFRHEHSEAALHAAGSGGFEEEVRSCRCRCRNPSFTAMVRWT